MAPSTGPSPACYEERQRYRDLFEMVPDGYLVTSVEGVVQKANQAMSNLLALSAQFLAGKPLLVLIAPEDRRDFSYQLHRLAQHQRATEFETRLQPGLMKVGAGGRITNGCYWRFFESFDNRICLPGGTNATDRAPVTACPYFLIYPGRPSYLDRRSCRDHRLCRSALQRCSLYRNSPGLDHHCCLLRYPGR